MVACRGALAAALLLALAGCPLQTPAVGIVTPGLTIEVSSGAPLPNETITLTAHFITADVDLSSAIWTTSDDTILSLASTKGASIKAMAINAGLATVTVTAGGLRGAVAITVLGSIGNIAIHGPTAMAVGTDATYTATVTDATGRTFNATVTWVAKAPLAFKTPGSNTGASMVFQATAVGAGAVTAQAGDMADMVGVKVSETNGQLVITRADGTAVPSAVAVGDSLTVAASYADTMAPANDARWTATGTCMALGASGPTLSVQEMGSGACTLTATTKGMQATVTFQIVSVTGVKIVTVDAAGTGPLALGDSRMFSAVGLAGTVETGAVDVTWSSGGDVLTLQPAGSLVKVTGAQFGTSPLVATLPGNITSMVELTVVPTSIHISASGARVPLGGGTTVTVQPLGPGDKMAPFASASGVTLAGATGFGTVGAGVLQMNGTVTFALGNVMADSPAVTVSFAGTTSNALSFTVAQIAKVVVTGPQGPIRMGSNADFVAMPVDDTGARIDGDLAATWADATGVYTFPASNGTLKVTADAVKLGTSAIVGTVGGVASMPYASPVQPASVGITAFSPASIVVGGTATTTISVLDAGGQPIPGIPLSQVLLMADDGTKVSIDAGTIVNGGFVFTATGLAATPAKGVNIQATWTDGMYPVQSTAVPLIVTP
jgi:hypothetical protein